MAREEAIMAMASKLAIEQVTQALAEKARQFAVTMPATVSGRDALNAFADAIDSTNAKTFDFGARQ